MRPTIRVIAALTLAGGLVLTACEDGEETASQQEPEAADIEDAAEDAGGDAAADDGGAGDDADDGAPDDAGAGGAPEEGAGSEDEEFGGFGGPGEFDGDSGVGGVDALAEIQLPGEAVPMYFSEPGVQVAVVGLHRDEPLIARETPEDIGVDVGYYAPLSSTTITGRERYYQDTQWAEVSLSDGVGWVPAHYLGYLGPSTDRTADFTQHSHSEALDVAVAIGDQIQQDGDARPQFTIAAETERGDGVEYVLDVLGYADDSVRGERLVITLEQAGGQYQVQAVDSTAICGRGVTDGVCL